MSAIDLQGIEISPRRNPDNIRRRTFPVVRRGYDPDQVRAYLEQVAAWVAELEAQQVSSGRAAAATSPAGEDPFERLGGRVAEIVRAAEQQADATRREIEEQSDRLLAEARQEAEAIRREAERIRKEAADEADRIRREAAEEAAKSIAQAREALARTQTEATAMVSGLEERRDALLAELGTTRERLLGIADELDGAIHDRTKLTWDADLAVEVRAPQPAGVRSMPPPPMLDDRDFDRLLEETPSIDLVLPEIPTFEDPTS